ncbi:MAG: hypothetical protein P1V20_02765 [Verrucomicrobiales bacterium]|nr:hypothetical protein [Verrucomicrobiales bacterium]
MKSPVIFLFFVFVWLPSSALANRKDLGKLFFQPAIHYSGKDQPEKAGTGFFVNGPGGKLFGITCARIIDTSKTALKVDWQIPSSRKSVAAFPATLGPPGKAGVDLPAFDYRSDFLIFPYTGEKEPDCLALNLNKRPLNAKLDTAWFPYRDERAKNGWRKIKVKIVAIEEGAIGVFLGENVDLEGRTGSPLISTRGGKVIGLLVGNDQLPNGKTVTLFAPVTDLAFQLNTETETVSLDAIPDETESAVSAPVMEFAGSAPSSKMTGRLKGSKWEGKTPYGFDVTVSFSDSTVEWDGKIDWSSEYKQTDGKNQVIGSWKGMRTVVTFTFDEDFKSCEVVVAANPNPVTLSRAD